MARLVESRPPSAGSLASSATRPSSSQSTTNFSRPLSAAGKRRSTASSVAPSTRPTSMASTMDMIAEQDTPRQELMPGQLQSNVWKDKHGRFGGRWAYVLEKPKALYDTDSEDEGEKEEHSKTPEESAASRRRSKRISILSTMQNLNDSSEIRERPASRNVSGETLVSAGNSTARSERDILDSALDMDWEIEKLPVPAAGSQNAGDRKMKRQNSRLSMIGGAIVSTMSVLGKRGRQAIESGKDKLQSLKDDKGKGKRARKEDVQDEQEEEEEEEEAARPAKKARVAVVARAKAVEVTSTSVAAPHLHGWRRKRWLGKGLYMAQERDFDPRLNEARNKKKRASQAGVTTASRTVLPLPMFRGEQLLENGHRDFKLPFDVYCPLPPGSTKPDTWGKFSTNRFVGDAADEWKHHKPLPPSKCLCTQDEGCDENCHNRFMLYECDDSNCNVGVEFCTNRPFADLKERCKTGRKFDVGVEVVKTESKGFGVRACRTFEPGQIIVEYAGEIITQDECERRVATEYANNACYYLMTFDQNMIIDATRGSMARFINHSCEPNCHMVKWIVAGKPRMALFAGDDGVMTGEELTYDYNFDPFSQKNVQTCHCGAPTCRGFLGPKLNKPARLSRSASAEEDEQQGRPKQKKRSRSNDLLKRASASLQNLLGPSEDVGSSGSTSRKRKSTGTMSNELEVGKKRRRNTDSNAMMLLRDVASDNKRIFSTSTGGSTLVEGSGSVSSKDVQAADDDLPTRKNTLNAIRDVAKTIKRNATSLRARASIRRATNKQKADERETEDAQLLGGDGEEESSSNSLKRVSRVPSLEKLVLDFGDGAADGTEADTEKADAGMGKAAVFGETARDEEEQEDDERPGTASTVTGPGIVRSIKGSRRVAAAKRAGVTYGKKMGKSMRIVTNGTTRGEQ